MSTIQDLTWQTLTAAVNEMKSPNQFLKKMLFPNHQPVPTETIELSILLHLREMAPFVRKNGEAMLVGGHDEKFVLVTPPNIRIKRPFVPSELLFGRRAGTSIYPTQQEQSAAIQQHINRDLQVMADDVTNSEEWLCAMAIQGVISYNVDDSESYQITYPIPSTSKITLSTFWDNADPTLPTIEADFFTAKNAMSLEVGLVPTDVILGASATTSFLAVLKKQYTTALPTVLDPGNINMQAQYTEDGALFLGRFGGLNVWSYPRQIPVPNGNGTFVTTDLIRSKYAEFICNSPAAERIIYYGAIPDFDAFQGGLWVAERFAKSWLTKDPSQMMALLHSRPLPCLRRPGAGVSMKVISG